MAYKLQYKCEQVYGKSGGDEAVIKGADIRTKARKVKRSALIITDDPNFEHWVRAHLKLRWPMLMIESTRLDKAGFFLDRTSIDRYRLIVLRLSVRSYQSVVTCIMLMRVLNLDNHPEVLIVADSDEELAKVRSTKLGNARSC